MANIKRAATSGLTKSGTAIPDVPDAPTIGAATDVGTSRAFNNGAATVAFTAAATGGSPSSYTATSSPGGFTASGASSPLTVTGLQSATSYTFTVSGTNSTATGPVSSASNSITATTVPQAPTIGTATATTSTAATVEFTAGANGGKTVSTYTATSSPGSITGTSSSSPITVSGLTSGTAYTFTVTATNANGTSTASAASNSVTPVLPSGYYSISSNTVSGTSTTLVTFNNIPQVYDDLVLIWEAAGNSGTPSVYAKVNNSTDNLHMHGGYYFDVVAGGSPPSDVEEFVSYNGLLLHGWYVTNTGPTEKAFGRLEISNYASSTRKKVGKGISGEARSTEKNEVDFLSFLYNSNTPITRLDIYMGSGGTDPFCNNSNFQLYGIKY